MILKLMIFVVLVNPLIAYAEYNWLTPLREVVEINSATNNAQGLELVREVLIPRFRALGLREEIFDTGPGHKIISFSMPGTRPKVVLLGHIDTVFSKDSRFQEFKDLGDRVTGPGVIDMKGGVVLMFHLLSKLSIEERGQIRIVLNDDEEIGSPHSKPLLKTFARGSKAVLVFEPGLPDGSVVRSHSGVRWYEMTVQGKAAHAGLEHHLGYNACVELSHKTLALAALTKYEAMLTVNPGVIRGGSKPNVVCEKASVQVDIRFLKNTDIEQTVKAMETIRDRFTVVNDRIDFIPTAELKLLAGLPSMPAEATKTLFEKAQSVATELGLSIKGVHVGYASDANHLAETGVDLLVGLGPFGGGMHSDEEFLLKSSYQDRLNLSTVLVRKLIHD